MLRAAGVVKDWVLIYLSWAIFKSPVTQLNLIGYGISFAGVLVYNNIKLKMLAEENAKKSDIKVEVEMEPLPVSAAVANTPVAEKTAPV